MCSVSILILFLIFGVVKQYAYDLLISDKIIFSDKKTIKPSLKIDLNENQSFFLLSFWFNNVLSDDNMVSTSNIFHFDINKTDINGNMLKVFSNQIECMNFPINDFRYFFALESNELNQLSLVYTNKSIIIMTKRENSNDLRIKIPDFDFNDKNNYWRFIAFYFDLKKKEIMFYLNDFGLNPDGLIWILDYSNENFNILNSENKLIAAGSINKINEGCNCEMKNFRFYYNLIKFTKENLFYMMREENRKLLFTNFNEQSPNKNTIKYNYDKNNLFFINNTVDFIKTADDILDTNEMYLNVSGNLLLKSNIPLLNYFLKFWIKIEMYQDVDETLIFESNFSDYIYLSLTVLKKNVTHFTIKSIVFYLYPENSKNYEDTFDLSYEIWTKNWIHFILYSIRNPSLLEIYLQLINKITDISINFAYKISDKIILIPRNSVFIIQIGSILSASIFKIKQFELYSGSFIFPFNLSSDSISVCRIQAGVSEEFNSLYDKELINENKFTCILCKQEYIQNSNGLCFHNKLQSCDINSVFNSELSICQNCFPLNCIKCLSNEYLIYYKCEKCMEKCIKCNEISKCITCESDYNLNENSECVIKNKCDINFVFYNNSCKNCSLIQGIKQNCDDICGNGFLYNFTNNIECDDGNRNSNDGCSSDCKIEKNYICNRLDNITPSYCFDNRPLNAKLIISLIDAKISFIKFDREIKELNKFLNINQSINIYITNLNESKYRYEITKIDSKTLKIELNFKVSFQNLNIVVLFMNPNDFMDNNNVSLIGYYNFSKTPYILNETLPVNIELSDETKSNIEIMYETTKDLAIFTFSLTALPSLLFNFLQFLWFMLDLMQLSNFFLLINIYLPLNCYKILNVFALSNLDFIPNFISIIFGINTKEQYNNINKNFKAPYKFDLMSISSSFISNAGHLTIILFSFHILYFSLRQVIKYKKKFKNNIMILIINNIDKYFTYSLLIRLQFIFFLRIMIAIFLRLRGISAISNGYFYDYLFAIFGFIYMVYFMYYILKLINNEYALFNFEKYVSKFSAIFENLNMNNFFGRNFSFLVCIKKTIICFILVFIHDFPYIELVLLIFLQSVTVFILFKFQVFTSKTMNNLCKFGEILFLMSLLVFFALKIFYEKKINIHGEILKEDVEIFMNLGWIVTSIFIILIFSFFIGLNLSYFKQIKLFCIGILIKIKEKRNNKKIITPESKEINGHSIELK